MSKSGILKAGRPSAAKNKAATLASLADNKVYKRLNIQLEVDTHNRFKAYVSAKGKSMSEVLTAYIERVTKNVGVNE